MKVFKFVSEAGWINKIRVNKIGQISIIQVHKDNCNSDAFRKEVFFEVDEVAFLRKVLVGKFVEDLKVRIDSVSEKPNDGALSKNLIKDIIDEVMC